MQPFNGLIVVISDGGQLVSQGYHLDHKIVQRLVALGHRYRLAQDDPSDIFAQLPAGGPGKLGLDFFKFHVSKTHMDPLGPILFIFTHHITFTQVVK
jgi:hypothetical protein